MRVKRTEASWDTSGGGYLDLGEAVVMSPAIVGVLGDGASLMVEEAVELGADILEVRLDLISGEPVEEMAFVRDASPIPLIATNRMLAEGGSFTGTEEARVDLLLEASRYADLVDIELRSDLLGEVVSAVNGPVLVSYHDFEGMPGPAEIGSILEEMAKAGAYVSKIAVTPSSLAESLELLRILLEASRPLCLIAMGEVGRHLRAVAPVYGSVLTYGYLSKAAAPGQMHVADLVDAFRILGLHPG